MASSSSSSSSALFRFAIKWILLPYGIGWLLSQYASAEVTERVVSSLLGETTTRNRRATVENVSSVATDGAMGQRDFVEESLGGGGDLCWQRFMGSLEESVAQSVEELLQAEEQGGVKLVLHRNGDVEGCGSSLNFMTELRIYLNRLGDSLCPVAFSKYQVESILTSVFHQSMGASCISQESDRSEWEGFLGYCDMGEDKTPILLDHKQLVPVAMDVISDGRSETRTYLPCHFHSREGVRLTSFEKIVQRIVQEYQKQTENQLPQCLEVKDNQQQTCNAKVEKQVDLYAVPAGRVFMFAPAYVGEVFDLPHIQGADPSLPVYMKVLSVSPRMFDIFNYFTKEESAELVERALREKSDTHRIKRSSTGASGYNINQRRTSENGFDTHGRIAQAVKRRCFSVLGFDEYIEGHSDGLQILRYNTTKAYTAHMDWIDDDGKQDHDYNSAGKGGNRYATILLYMTDLKDGDGGETAFVNAMPASENAPSYNEALTELRSSQQATLFKKNSWEEKMVARCRSSLAVQPNSARAVLFYSQHPNGEPDKASLHGGCPVVSSTPKWAANLWVWNTPRAGFAGAPMNEKRLAEKRDKGEVPTVPSDVPPKKHVTFQNSGSDPTFENAELYYEDQYWGRLGDGDAPHAVNSYEGQVWYILVDGAIKKTFSVNKEPVQVYTI
ncbi:Probable prolyl 4-hydroxylase [Seminavis robusta]|uniref:Probable prolyl 4-hydroxylase n=1 Tax=Seminavis robusta TaxID=568900 RepID=A0A9N8DYI6_9STRA|nr:Probable prolyl 4-hydroxylase [Seminavis robusta]|eukprot:Sro448_g145070.1 Probable prolyl 4-hydroxylase (670) ;mRNA; r:9267-11642